MFETHFCLDSESSVIVPSWPTTREAPVQTAARQPKRSGRVAIAVISVFGHLGWKAPHSAASGFNLHISPSASCCLAPKLSYCSSEWLCSLLVEGGEIREEEYLSQSLPLGNHDPDWQEGHLAGLHSGQAGPRASGTVCQGHLRVVIFVLKLLPVLLPFWSTSGTCALPPPHAHTCMDTHAIHDGGMYTHIQAYTQCDGGTHA